MTRQGVLEWLQRLQEKSFRQGVASSALPTDTITLVDELGLRGYFDVLVSGVDLPGKTDPALLLKVVGRLDLPPGRCVFVEDSVAGLEAADVVVGRLDVLAASGEPQ